MGGAGPFQSSNTFRNLNALQIFAHFNDSLNVFELPLKKKNKKMEGGNISNTGN